MARQIARNLALTAVFLAGNAGLAGAQPRMNRGPNLDAPKLMVSACRIADKAVALQCADRIRDQIEGDVSFRSLLVMSKSDVENTLSASGYDPAVALAQNDAMALAKQLHADMYIEASAEKGGPGLKVQAWVVLSRDANMRQQIGTFEHARMETIAGQVSKGFREVFEKTFERQKDCFMRERERRYDDAMKEVVDGLKSYPESAWLRHCKLALLKDQKASGAEVAALLEEIIKGDPGNKTALRDLVVIYDTEGNKAKKLEMLEALHLADPMNARLTAEIVNTYAQEGMFDKARPIAEKAVAENPGDINLVRPYWLILMNAKEYKKAIEVGKQMATMDTTTADTTYFQRMISAAGSDSNYAEAALLANRARQKFPKVTQFYMLEYAAYQRVGDNAKALAAAKAAIAVDPTVTDLRARVAAAYLAENPPLADSAIAIVKEMIARGEDKEQIAAVAVQTANTLRIWVDTLRGRGADAAALQAANEHGYPVAAWADTLATGTQVAAQGKFIMGLLAFNVGSAYITKGGEAVNGVIAEIRAMKPIPDAARQKAMLDPAYAQACSQVKMASEYILVATTAVPAGGRFAPDAARQVMGQVMQMSTYLETATKQFCNR